MTPDVTKAARMVAEAAADVPVEAVPRRVCAAVCEGLGMDGTTLSLLTETPSRQLLAASNDAALLLEEIQFTGVEGPCAAAAHRSLPHRQVAGRHRPGRAARAARHAVTRGRADRPGTAGARAPAPAVRRRRRDEREAVP